MEKIAFKILGSNDQQYFELIAGWYLREWNIPVERTLKRLQTITIDGLQFQVIMTLSGVPITTAGVYNHVGLLDKEPKFEIYKHWLALVYTVPNQRRNGYGTLICNFILEHSRSLGIETLHLFTDTAEPLYKRIGWQGIERVSMGDRKVVVMELNI